VSRSLRIPAGVFDGRQQHMKEGKVIVLKAVFGDNPPCSTWIGVPRLAVEEFLVEVEPSVVFLAPPGSRRQHRLDALLQVDEGIGLGKERQSAVLGDG
jgi:hypothetical protein